ncbi:MAG: kelch repeat-containing protein [Bryobacteraceae bacterium]|jgi:hypothetical protein
MKYRLVLVLTGVPLWPAMAAAADAPAAPAVEWVKLTPTVSPSPRDGMAMAYDVVSGKIVLFGGLGANTSYLGDTWTFDGVTWTQLTPPVSPPARVSAGMTFDALLQKLVMFGGYTEAAGYFGDTWIFDGAAGTWEEAKPYLSPPPVTAPCVFTDPDNGSADVFGGFNSESGYSAGTWMFAGTTWLQLQPATSPAGRTGALSAFDHVAKNAVLFGGEADVSAQNTWTWDGANWTEQAPARQPPLLEFAAAAFDPGFRLLIAFGGESGGMLQNGTWAWTGSDWAQLHPTTWPPPREFLGMANDEAIGHVILFGGTTGYVYFDDTWELIPAAAGQ